MHIAAALKKRVISVWGNTVPDFGMTAYYGNEPIKELQLGIKVWCRPCSKIGYHKCPLGHFKCMNNHDMDQLAITAMEWAKH
jgi:ADP-heptose:LPS heptosyltransferase